VLEEAESRRAVGPAQQSQDVEQRTLAAARGPDYAERLAALQVEPRDA